jgi:hypothetical protein
MCELAVSMGELVQLVAYVQLSEVVTTVQQSAIQDVLGMSVARFGSVAGDRALCTWQFNVDLGEVAVLFDLLHLAL